MYPPIWCGDRYCTSEWPTKTKTKKKKGVEGGVDRHGQTLVLAAAPFAGTFVSLFNVFSEQKGAERYLNMLFCPIFSLLGGL